MRRCLFLLVLTLLVVACKSKLVKSAEEFIRVKEYEKAAELLRMELQANPTDVDTYLLLGKVELLRGRERAAREAFDKAVLLDTDAREDVGKAYLAAAQALHDDASGRLDRKALQRFTDYLEVAVKHDPDLRDEIKDWTLRRTKEVAAGQRTDAPLAIYAALLKVAPDAEADVANASINIAKEYAAKGFTHDAVRYAERAGKHRELSAAAARVIRDATLKLLRHDASVQEYLRLAITLDPSLEQDDTTMWLLLPPGEYLLRFPNGKHRNEALAALRTITPEEGTRQTRDALRDAIVATEAYRNDRGTLPEGTIDQVPRVLEGVFIKRLPRADAWGTKLHYRTTTTGYVYASAGPDRRFDPITLQRNPAQARCACDDIIMSNGRFIEPVADASTASVHPHLVPPERLDPSRALRVGGDVKAPVVLQRVEPTYPDAARKARISGIVIVEAIIDERGNVTDLVVLKPLPFGLDQAAVDAVKQWKFRPTTQHGKPVPVIFDLTINFKLDTSTPASPQVSPYDAMISSVGGGYNFRGLWTFDTGLENQKKGAHAPINHNAVVRDGALHLTGGTWVNLQVKLNSDAYTISCWLRPTATKQRQAVISNVRNSGIALRIDPAADLPLGFHYLSTLKSQASVHAPILRNAWQHVAVTWDGSWVRMYHNGKQTQELRTNVFRSPYSNVSVYLGRGDIDGQGDVQANDYEGAIDDVLILGRALNPEQVASLAQYRSK